MKKESSNKNKICERKGGYNSTKPSKPCPIPTPAPAPMYQENKNSTKK